MRDAEPTPFLEEPCHTRVGGDASERVAELGGSGGTDGTEPDEKVARSFDRARGRSLEPRERVRVFAEADELQDRAGEVRARDLGIVGILECVLLARTPHSQAASRRDSTGAACALFGRGLRDAFELQTVEPHGRVQTADAPVAGIHDDRHPFDRDGGLRDVGGQDDAATRPGAQRGVLSIGREIAIQLEDVDVRQASELLRGPADFADPRQEREQVSLGLERETLADEPGDGGFDGVRGRASVVDGDRMEAPATLDDRSLAEERLERGGFKRRGHGDELQIGPGILAHPACEGERQVRVEASLVELVEHDRADAFEKRIGLESSQQDAFRHDEDARARSGDAIEPDVVTHLGTEVDAALFGDPSRGRSGGDAPRFEHDDRVALRDETRVEQRGRNARGLAGTRRRAQDERAVFAQRVDELGDHLIDRQGRTRASALAHEERSGMPSNAATVRRKSSGISALDSDSSTHTRIARTDASDVSPSFTSYSMSKLLLPSLDTRAYTVSIIPASPGRW